MAFVFALLMNFGSYWFSDKIVLAMYGAQPVDEAAAPEIYRDRPQPDEPRRAAHAARVPHPRATPRTPSRRGATPQHAAVAVTEGILRILSEDELEGVLAHELSHVKNRDTLIMTIAATLAGAITYLAHMAQWAAMFGGGRRSDDDDAGGSASARS